jgi:hypothetical protein
MIMERAVVTALVLARGVLETVVSVVAVEGVCRLLNKLRKSLH